MTVNISLRPMCLRGGGVPGVLAPRWESVVEEVRMEYDVSPASGDMVIPGSRNDPSHDSGYDPQYRM